MIIEQIGRYQISAKIGQGGMGTVYSASDTLLQREVAIKLLAAHLGQNETFRQRFQQEAHIVAQLEHAHIVPIYDVGEYEQRPYLVMRLLRGGSLREKMAGEGISAPVLLNGMAQVAGALDNAHENHVIHRDIKPTNILFDEQGSAFISDFGIAKILDETSQLTKTGMVGTPAYMSPEHLRGNAVDGRSDQYSLAIVLFEALSGQPLFSGTTMQLLYKQVHEVPSLLHEVNPAFSAAMSVALNKGLAKEPAQRYASVREMVTAVQQAMTTHPAAMPQMASEAKRTPVEAIPLPVDLNSVLPDSLLEQDYIVGYQAFKASQWPQAERALKQVVDEDRYYKDALKLYGEARRRQRQTVIPPLQTVQTTDHATTTVMPGAGGSKQKGIKSKWLMVVGIAIITLLIVGGSFWQLQNSTVVAQANEPVTDSHEILPIAYILVQQASPDANWQADQIPKTLTGGSRIPLYADVTPITLFSGHWFWLLLLPDDTRISLGKESTLVLTAVYDLNGSERTKMQLQNGRVLIQNQQPTGIENIFGAEARLENGLMGVQIDARTSRFDIDCLQGECLVKGDMEDNFLSLKAGEFTFVGGSGVPESAEPARFEQYTAMLNDVPTPTETAVNAVLSSTSPPIVVTTATLAATQEPTTTPRIIPTKTVTPQPTQRVVGSTSGSGLPLGFENFGLWTIGDEDKGTFTQSNEQSHTGSYAARFTYDFSTSENDYVVFMQTNPIEGTPNALKIWVYGDRSGHYLNAWIRDDEGQTWQVSFGKVNHSGWQQMTGIIDTNQDWPWGHINGANNNEVDYPIQLRGLVLDDAYSDYIGQGSIYLDDLTATTVLGVANGESQQPTGISLKITETVTAPSPIINTTPVAVDMGSIGRILYTSVNTLLTTDPSWSSPQEIGTASQNSCGSKASIVTGQTFSLFHGNYCGVGEGPSTCASPNGQYEVFTSGNYSDGFVINIRLAGATDNGAFVYSGEFDNNEGIRWSPTSNGFLFVVRDTVLFGRLSGGYDEIIPTAYNPVFSPNGSQILYLKPIGPGINDIFVSNSDGTNAQNITNVSTIDKKCAAWILN